MKKLFAIALMAMLVVTLLLGSVMAGGDKNRGEIGIGDTWENNCEDQPCFEDAPKPGSSSTEDAFWLG